MLTLTVDSAGLASLIETVVTATLERLQVEKTLPVQAVGQIEPLLVPTGEAARRLSISERLLWDMTYPRGPIPSVKVGSRVLYSVEALRQWIALEEAPDGSAVTK
ncbi:MAG: helix-turn-helix domain-containing protein [Planctomycetota bacterium]